MTVAIGLRISRMPMHQPARTPGPEDVERAIALLRQSFDIAQRQLPRGRSAQP